MRHVSANLVTAASLSGIAAGFAHTQRCTRDEALAEVAQTLAQATVRGEQRRQVLNRAAAMYAGPVTEATWWHGAALELLVEARADPEQAAEIHRHRAARAGGPLR